MINLTRDKLFEAWWEEKGMKAIPMEGGIQPILIQALKGLCREAWDRACEECEALK